MTQTRQRTWNSPEQIARHRAMSVEERLKRCIELSRAALSFKQAERVESAEPAPDRSRKK